VKRKIIIIGICFLGLVLGPISGISDSNKNYIDENLYDNIKAVGIQGEKLIKSDITLGKIKTDYYKLGTDIQITSSEFDESHPVIDIDYNGNPLLLYQLKEDVFSSNIYIQRSPDQGVTWPEDSIYYWESEDYALINPDLNFVDGVRAFGTHELEGQEPYLYIQDYVDVDQPDTWVLSYFDRSGAASYVSETAVAANKSGSIAFGSIQDYQGDDYFEDTLLITWDGNNLDDDTADGGVYWLNRDNDENSIPYSNLCADAGDKIFFVFQRNPLGEKSQIATAYCKVDENTLYSDWTQRSVATSSQYNHSYPDISVNGKNAYVTYMCDKDGNQDIYVSFSSTGSFWRKYQVTATPEDEYYPVIYADDEKINVLFMRDGNLYITYSEDDCESWSDAELVNDESNKVVQEFQNSDVTSTLGIWTDNRNDNYDIYIDEVGTAAILVIDQIKGGFGVELTISNVGNAPAENILWSIDLEGGIILTGDHSEGTVNINPGDSVKVKTDLILGLGRVSILATCSDSKKTSNGFALGPFILGVE